LKLPCIRRSQQTRKLVCDADLFLGCYKACCKLGNRDVLRYYAVLAGPALTPELWKIATSRFGWSGGRMVDGNEPQETQASNAPSRARSNVRGSSKGAENLREEFAYPCANPGCNRSISFGNGYVVNAALSERFSNTLREVRKKMQGAAEQVMALGGTPTVIRRDQMLVCSYDCVGRLVGSEEEVGIARQAALIWWKAHRSGQDIYVTRDMLGKRSDQ